MQTPGGMAISRKAFGNTLWGRWLSGLRRLQPGICQTDATIRIYLVGVAWQRPRVPEDWGISIRRIVSAAIVGLEMLTILSPQELPWLNLASDELL